MIGPILNVFHHRSHSGDVVFQNYKKSNLSYKQRLDMVGLGPHLTHKTTENFIQTVIDIIPPTVLLMKFQMLPKIQLSKFYIAFECVHCLSWLLYCLCLNGYLLLSVLVLGTWYLVFYLVCSPGCTTCHTLHLLLTMRQSMLVIWCLCN